MRCLGPGSEALGLAQSPGGSGGSSLGSSKTHLDMGTQLRGGPAGVGAGAEAPRGASSSTSLGFFGFISVQEPLPSPHCPGGLPSQPRPRSSSIKAKGSRV